MTTQSQAGAVRVGLPPHHRSPAAARTRRLLAVALGAASLVAALLVVAPGTAHAADAGPIKSSSGTCVEVTGGGSADGTRARLGACDGSAKQQWTVQSDGTIRALGKCLDVSGANSADGTAVQLWTCNGTGAQKWTANGDGTLRALGTCLDGTGPSTAAGTQLQVWSCHAGENQRWSVAAGTGPTQPPTTGTAALRGAPYIYLGWGNPPKVADIMSSTGVRGFTMAFMLDSGGCTPAWDGNRPLTGGNDEASIKAIKAAGGQVTVSFGGASGSKLGSGCSSSSAYAAAVQKVIDAYQPTAVDFDLEGVEYDNNAIQDRILGALPTVKQRNPSTAIVVTLPVEQNGLVGPGARFVQRAAELKTPIDNYTVMPFDFNASDMVAATVSSTEGLKNQLKSANGWDDKTAYAHMGISGMNGRSDVNETTSVEQWQRITDHAKQKGMGRLAFWAVNRDRSCGGGNNDMSSCSFVGQADWAFTKITAQF